MTLWPHAFMDIEDIPAPQHRSDFDALGTGNMNVAGAPRLGSRLMVNIGVEHMSVIDEIAAERRRQIEVEGWTAEHDDGNGDMSLARAAAVYAYVATLTPEVVDIHRAALFESDDGLYSAVAAIWPWSYRWFKPKGSRRDLIRSAALIVAEIERIDRYDQRHAADFPPPPGTPLEP